MDLVKTCSKCGEVKPVEAFGARGRQCKLCKRALLIDWSKNNPEKVAAHRKSYYESNRKKLLAASKSYRENNREQVRAQKKIYYAANSEKVRAAVSAYTKANYEKVRERIRSWQTSNPERVLAYAEKSRLSLNPEKVRAWRKTYYETNQHKRDEYQKARQENLADSYVRQLLTQKSPIKEVPQTLIDLKRVQVLITRKLKELRCK